MIRSLSPHRICSLHAVCKLAESSCIITNYQPRGRELKLNKEAATSELYYLLQWEGTGAKEETFYKSFGVGSKMQILYSRAQKEMGFKMGQVLKGGFISHIASLFGYIFSFASSKYTPLTYIQFSGSTFKSNKSPHITNQPT